MTGFDMLLAVLLVLMLVAELSLTVWLKRSPAAGAARLYRRRVDFVGSLLFAIMLGVVVSSVGMAILAFVSCWLLLELTWWVVTDAQDESPGVSH